MCACACACVYVSVCVGVFGCARGGDWRGGNC